MTAGRAITYAMIEKLERSCNEARSLTGRGDEEFHLSSPGVSAWSVAQHLDHLARAQRGCVAAAEHILAGRGDLTGEPTGQGRQVLEEERIPRGMGEAPERTRPVDRPDREKIRSLLESAQARVQSMSARTADLAQASGRVAHQDLGSFSAVEWLRFAAIHNRHHLAIIGEILRGGDR